MEFLFKCLTWYLKTECIKVDFQWNNIKHIKDIYKIDKEFLFECLTWYLKSECSMFIKLNTRREFPYLQGAIVLSFLLWVLTICQN